MIVYGQDAHITSHHNNNRKSMLNIILRYNVSRLQKMLSLQCGKKSHKASGCGCLSLSPVANMTEDGF